MEVGCSKVLALGTVVATPAALDTVGSEVMYASLERHRHCDWGDVSPSGGAANDDAVATGEDRVLSVYTDGEQRFWIITEWDRSVTTILLPDDY